MFRKKRGHMRSENASLKTQDARNVKRSSPLIAAKLPNVMMHAFHVENVPQKKSPRLLRRVI